MVNMMDTPYVPPVAIDQRGHTGSKIIEVVEGTPVDLRLEIGESFQDAWASCVPNAMVSNTVTNYVSFTSGSNNVIVNNTTTVTLYWK